MSSASARSAILILYRQMLREAQKFSSYIYRNYAIRRIRDGFKEHKLETDQDKIRGFVEEAEKNLEVIRRQVVVNKLYETNKLVIENNQIHPTGSN